MKISEVKRIFSGHNLYVKVVTDDGLYGLGECTLNSRELAVASVLEHLEPVLQGQDPFRIEHIWQDVFRCTFWRGGPVLAAGPGCSGSGAKRLPGGQFEGADPE